LAILLIVHAGTGTKPQQYGGEVVMTLCGKMTLHYRLVYCFKTIHSGAFVTHPRKTYIETDITTVR